MKATHSIITILILLKDKTTLLFVIYFFFFLRFTENSIEVVRAAYKTRIQTTDISIAILFITPFCINMYINAV